jgi:hypothetical protein
LYGGGNLQPEEIDERLKRIEDSIAKLIGIMSQCQITIQQVDIHNPKIDSLSFTLDSLDIDDLSGALNLGNNFGVEVKKKQRGQDKKKKKKVEDEIKESIVKGCIGEWENKDSNI